MKKILIAILLVQISIVFASFSYNSSPAIVQVNYINQESVSAADLTNLNNIATTTVAYPALNPEIEILDCTTSVYDSDGSFLYKERTDDVNIKIVNSFVMRELYGHRIDIHLTDNSQDKIRVISSVKFNLSSSKRVPVPEKISPAFLPSYKKMIDNFEQSYLRNLPFEDLRMHIIVQDDWVSYLDPLVKWKNARGILTDVSTFSMAGTTVQEIKQYINTLYESDIPPTYVILVGDTDEPCNVPTYYTGPEVDAADLPYTLLEGDDYMPELIIGRMSVDSQFELSVVVDKILLYEKNPYMGDSGWFKRALVIAGNYATSWPIPETPVNVSGWLTDKLYDKGFDEVEEVYYPAVYPGTPEIISAINNGVSLVSYRGWGDANGWHFPELKVADLANLNNGYQLPVIASFVCNTGDFANTSVDPCFGEALLRLGLPTTPQGCITFVGPSYLYTRSKYNNSLFTGYYTGLLDEQISTFGDLVLRAKSELYCNFPHEQLPGGDAELYYNIYNIIGDPTIMIWTDTPDEIACSLPNSVNIGDNYLSLQLPGMDGAIITAYKEDEFLNKAAVENGEALIYLDSQSEGEIEITITKMNYKPFIETIDVVSTDVELILSVTSDNVTVGETVEIDLTLDNIGGVDSENISAFLTSSDPFVTIQQQNLEFGSISGGSSNSVTCQLEISELCPDQHSIIFQLEIGDYGSRKFQLDVIGMMLEISSVEIDGEGYLVPGESAVISCEIINSGNLDLTGLEISALSLCDAVVTQSGNILLGDLNCGDIGSISFNASVAASCFNGRNFTLQLTANDSDGRVAVLQEILTIGQVSNTDPMGPDSYGYFAYDSNDTGFAEAPVYNWYNIDPELGGNGSELMLGDDDSETIALPFDFQYYGNVYDSLTICSNGWAAFQPTWYVDYINWRIPNGMGPYAMLAPFWDDLTGTVTYDGPNNAEVHADMRMLYGFMEEDNVFVVQWDCFNNYDNVGVEKFQIVLYDPSAYETLTGDGEIQFNYHTIDDQDVDNNYCTVGIENQEQNGGISYLYSNIYHPSSSLLENGLAIKFTTDAPDEFVNGSYSDINIIYTSLLQNYPNPFNPSTKIFYELKKQTAVDLTIYNSKGQVVKQVVKKIQKPGKYSVDWNGNDNKNNPVSSGVYFYRLKTERKSIIKKMILIK